MREDFGVGRMPGRGEGRDQWMDGVAVVGEGAAGLGEGAQVEGGGAVGGLGERRKEQPTIVMTSFWE